MNYQDNERQLVQLLRDLKYVPGTFPPVYIVGGVLIGYDKLGRIKIIGAINNNDPVKMKDGWSKQFEALMGALARAGMKFAPARGHNAAFAPKG